MTGNAPLGQRVRNQLHRLVKRTGFDVVRLGHPPDFSPQDRAIIEAVRPFTMTGPERVQALIRGSAYVLDRGLPGAFVECGVWRGGSMMAVALTLLDAGVTDRDLFLFDTYEGMPAPTDDDVSFRGTPAKGRFERDRVSEHASNWDRATQDEVRANLATTGYPAERLHFVKGRVQDTLATQAPEQIALLRLDTDWYESTLYELEICYPRLVSDGVLIIDDYGHWRGSRKATDQFFAAQEVRPLLQRIDYTGRIAIKPWAVTGAGS